MEATYFIVHELTGTVVHISHPLAFWLAEQLAKTMAGLNVEGGSEKGTVWVSIAHGPKAENTVMSLIARWGHENGLHKLVGEVQ